MNSYNFEEIEKKYQELWQQHKSFAAEESLNGLKTKYYVLSMFPYPSGKLHMGHLRNYVIGDVIARFKRALGFNVLHPIGWDAFGLPAENAAIEHRIHPKVWTEENIAKMRQSLKKIGLSYDWARELKTCDPDYYKYEQKFFLEFLKKGLAYQQEAEVNWDPIDNTVLANEQVIEGKGWRSGAIVEKRRLKQWFLKITAFAEELLNDLNKLPDWPEKVKVMQKNWIGKSEGAIINFKVLKSQETLAVFTTRPETIFGASFCAIAGDHPLLQKLAKNDHKEFPILEKYSEEKGGEKIGFFTNYYAENPFTGERLPIYIANFVLKEYGTGAIFGCPAHDLRDFEFAKKYSLPIRSVIINEEKKPEELTELQAPLLIEDQAEASFKLCNSDFLTDLSIEEARALIIKKIIELKLGEKKVNYRLKDWGVSRQRYWGCPIPIIYCENSCGGSSVKAVKQEDLPIKLPEDVNFEQGGNPLENHPTWKNTICPECGGPGCRETDTFDTFFESSWYFAAFCALERGINKKSCNHFLPVDVYIGGIEHAVLHLLYARFFTKALKELNYFDINEPFSKLVTQGMVCNKTYKDEKGNWLFPEEAEKLIQEAKAGKENKITVGRVEKMSKSKKNVVDPAIILSQYGADTARFFILSNNPPENDFEWSDAGVLATFKYLNKIYRNINSIIDSFSEVLPERSSSRLPDEEISRLLYKTIEALNDDIVSLRLNCAVAKIHELTNLVSSHKENKEFQLSALPMLIRVLEPFIPHLAEELFCKMQNCLKASSNFSNSANYSLLCEAPWPKIDSSLLKNSKAKIKIAVHLNGKFKTTIEILPDEEQKLVEEAALKALEDKIPAGKIPARIIYIPSKIINIIINN